MKDDSLRVVTIAFSYYAGSKYLFGCETLCRYVLELNRTDSMQVN